MDNRVSTLSGVGRFYVSAVAALGLPLGAYCVFALIHDRVPREFLIFAALTLLSGRFTLKVPSVEAHFSPSEMFVFASVLLFGPEAGAITLAADSVLIAWQRKLTRIQTLFNFANLTLSVWISGQLFFFAANVKPLFKGTTPSSGLILPLLLLAASYFVVNSGLTATAIALAKKRPPLAVWREHFLWLGPGYSAGACAALLLGGAAPLGH